MFVSSWPAGPRQPSLSQPAERLASNDHDGKLIVLVPLMVGEDRLSCGTSCIHGGCVMIQHIRHRVAQKKSAMLLLFPESKRLYGRWRAMCTFLEA